MPLRKTTGFTLVELVLTLGIAAMMSSIAALTVPAMLDSYRLKEATGNLVSSIREAQIRALREGRPWRVEIDPDGGGFSTQQAANSAIDPADCASTAGWTTVRSQRFPSSVRMDTVTMSRRCVGFTAGGQTGWPNPEVLLDYTMTPNYGGLQSAMRIVDGVQLSPESLPGDPRFDSKTIVWWNQNPVIVIDLDEIRTFTMTCIGLFSRMPTYRYPINVKVEASASASYPSATWEIIHNEPGPPAPQAGERQRVCMPIPVNSSYRYLRITLTRAGNYVVLDEFVAADLTFVVKGTRVARRVIVSPVTGRVTVQTL